MAGRVAAADSVAAAPRAIGKDDESMNTNVKSFLNPEQLRLISEAVLEAEKKTQGEIVPMVVMRSSAIGSVRSLVFLVFFSVLVTFLLAWGPWWFHEWRWELLIGAMASSFMIAFFLSRWAAVQRYIIPEADQQAQVWQRAQIEWANNKLQKTQQRTGILLFVSVMERKAVVLADQGIARFYKQETWDEIVQILSRHFKEKKWVEGFQKAIGRCGEILTAYLPAQGHNPNEISDQLIVKE